MPKFRVWDNKNRKFIKSPIVWFEDDEVRVFLDISDVVDWVEQTNVEVMQSTGLKDKNGVEIYEGDIVLWSSLCIWAHEYRKDKLKIDKVWWNPKRGCWAVGTEFCNFAIFNDVEVLGNIHENPELLK